MHQEQGPFAGRVAIITGGASGIGWALGAELYRHGAQTRGVGDLDENVTQTVADLIGASAPGAAGSVEGQALDVTDGDVVEALVRQVVERRGLDLMFNNVGICVGGPTHEMNVCTGTDRRREPERCRQRRHRGLPDHDGTGSRTHREHRVGCGSCADGDDGRVQ